MKAIIKRDRIRIKPVPKEDAMLYVVLRKPLNKMEAPIVATKVVKGQKFYDLPCSIDNILGLQIRGVV